MVQEGKYFYPALKLTTAVHRDMDLSPAMLHLLFISIRTVNKVINTVEYYKTKLKIDNKQKCKHGL